MASLLGEITHGSIFVVSAPAGTGKTTLVKKLTREFPQVTASLSYTTRLPRNGEVDGIDYQFVTNDQFQSQVTKGDFLEYVELYGTYYGTSKSWVKNKQEQGKHVILVIDTQGAIQLFSNLQVVSIFILPPSIEVLKQRLIGRGTEDEEMVKKRLEWAENEIGLANRYQYQIVNDNLEIAYDVLRSIIIAESHRTNHLK